VDTTHTLIHNIGAFSYLGVFVISILANVVVPVPEEIVIIAIGYVAGTGKINAFIALPIVIAGLMISDSVMYFLARRGTKVLTMFYDRLFAKSLGSQKELLENHPGKVIFYTRFLMQFRFVGPFIAGQRKMPWKKFVSYEFPALLIYVPALLALGDYFQDRLDYIVSGVGVVRNVILTIIGILVLVGISRFIRDITFGGYTLSLSGTKEEKMWIPWVYKKKK
jgi:membrane protein DedA with SNARE-associated domain